jgi:F-type H+-transporting ATPase subunit b
MDNPLVQLDPGLYIWTILTFLALVTLLAKFAWGPLLRALDERHARIAKALEDAEKAKQELARLQQESAQILAKARVDADAIVSRGRTDGERFIEETKQKSRDEAAAILRNAERQIQLETERALRQLRVEAGELSVMIASKIIRRNLTKEDNDALIREAIAQVESRAGSES